MIRLAPTMLLGLMVTYATAYAVLGARAQPERFVFSFGDSYSQTGFNITTGPLPSRADPFGNPPYPGYTTDNGANWVGVLIQGLSPANTLNYNFAYGGATVNASLVAPYEPTVLSLIDQVSEFSAALDNHPATAPWNSANSFFVIWMGVNDVGNSFYESGNLTELNEEIFDSYFSQVEILYQAGARSFLLLTVPPTYRTPMFVAEGVDTVAAVKADIERWNNELLHRTSAFRAGHGDGSFNTLATGPLFNGVLNHPKEYGAPNATCYNADGVSCLWWNNYHPGQAIQNVVGNAVHEALDSAGFYD